MMQTSPLAPASPETQGIPSSAIDEFVDAAQRQIDALHSFMLLRHGRVVAEGWWDPYTARDPHMLYSLSKSFTATAIGMLAADGKVSLDDLVISLLPDEVPARPSGNLRNIRVRHLLSMTTGHADEPPRNPAGNWMRDFLAHPVPYEPGTHFLYNTGATYMLSAIVQRRTGVRLRDYLRPRLFESLGIEHPTWEVSPEGIDTGGYGLSITTEHIARFGQLYLQRGVWQGARLMAEEWVEEATRRQVSNAPNEKADWEQGYGYQFWRCRHAAYRGDGAFGQFCLVMPAQDTVLAITAGTDDMQRVLDLVWRYVLPAMGPEPLPGDPTAQAALTSRLAGLRLPVAQGDAASPLAAGISGKTFCLAANPDQIETVRFDFTGTGCSLTLHGARGEEHILSEYGAWKRGGTLRLDDAQRVVGRCKVAASGAWKSEHIYVVEAWAYETPFKRTLVCAFDGDHLSIEQRMNVSFGSTDLPCLKGQIA